ncbi:MAG: gamma-glutamylcyclotransferase [Phycisphaerae bacterium]|nr:gamma-glutamylcyclotransferase [Phycisphaerae bacterium]
MAEKNFNMFVYGSLRDPSIFKSVCGLSFGMNPAIRHEKLLKAELALLAGYRKVSPDNVYYYAVKKDTSKLEGIIIYDVPAEAFAEIDRYEGKLYERETVTVATSDGEAEAEAYLVSHRSMRRRFGDRFHVNLIHELWLRKRIENFLKEDTRPGEESQDAEMERRARRELLGTTERDLVVSYLDSGTISDYYLEHELDRLYPSIKHLFDEAEALEYIPNYIGLMVKQVMFNQIEQTIQDRYRFEVDRLGVSPRYFTRCISIVVALRMMNANVSAIRMILKRCIDTMPCNGKYDLVDYVKYAVSAADSIFDSRLMRSEMERVRVNRQTGIMPMGAELELSNLGFNTIIPGSKAVDYVFDGFKYFEDFRLDILTWKLGGYIDDHGLNSKLSRRKGFLEFAPGRLNIIGELSKPATADPWLLNQLIHEICVFYPVRPHSLHLTFQLQNRQRQSQRMLRLSIVKCLFALGGGTELQRSGRLWVSRMGHDEIQQDKYGEELVFARSSKRVSQLRGDGIAEKSPSHATTYTQQYKFMRLDARANYEPLIMALKGLQIGYNPADYLTPLQLNSSKRARNQYEELKEWAHCPTEISRHTRSRFLQIVQHGLMNERNGKPAHKLHYIEWAIEAIDVQLRLFNKEVQMSR